MWIIIEGDLIDGYLFYGPFADYKTAYEYADKLCGYNRIIELRRPT